MKIAKTDVGEYVKDDKGKLHKIVTLSNRPVVELENIASKERKLYIIGSDETEGFVKLIPEL